MKPIKFILLFYLSFSVALDLKSQISTGEEPISLSHSIDITTLPVLVYTNEIDDYTAFNTYDCDTCGAQRCGINIPVSVDVMTESSVAYDDAELEIRMLRISIPNARSIGTYFSNYDLPAGYKFFAYNADYTQVVGSIEGNDRPEGETKFAIQAISGNEIILELVKIKALADETPELKIDAFALFAYDLAKQETFFTNSVTSEPGCYKDVFCGPSPEGRERGVAHWVFYDTQAHSYFVCSGSLLSQKVLWDDLKPYFYTANHCGKDADLSTIVFYFNYQAPVCSNTAPTNPHLSSYTMVGAWKKAQKGTSDMYLMQLYQIPPAHYNVRYLGWHKDPSLGMSDAVESIHHPKGYRKKYSSGKIAGLISPFKYGVDYDLNSSSSIADKGSSGCPLFIAGTSYVVANLSWGAADCDHQSSNDHYSRLKKHWDDPGGSGERLKDWLNPGNIGGDTEDPRDPCYYNQFLNAGNYYPASEYQPSNRVVIQAQNVLTNYLSPVTIKTGSEYAFTSNNVVEMLPGFSAEPGAVFSAYVASCTFYAPSHRMASAHGAADESAAADLPGNSFSLFPNPVHHEARFEILSDTQGIGTLRILDNTGRQVKELFSNKVMFEGINSFVFNDLNLVNGVYFCEYVSEHFTKTIKMAVIN